VSCRTLNFVNSQGETEELIDHDTAAGIQSIFGIVSRVSQTVLSGMSSRPRRPSGHVIFDVWDWLIDLFGSDFEGLGSTCQSLMASLDSVDWNHVAMQVAEDMDPEDAVSHPTLVAAEQLRLEAVSGTRRRNFGTAGGV